MARGAEVKNAKHGTVKKECACESEYQDLKYGKNVRLHNLSKGGTQARCTVCGKVK